MEGTRTTLEPHHPQHRASVLAAIGALAGVGFGLCGAPSTQPTVVSHDAAVNPAAASGSAAVVQLHGPPRPREVVVVRTDGVRPRKQASPPVAGARGSLPRPVSHAPESRDGGTAIVAQAEPAAGHGAVASSTDEELVEKLVGRWCREKFGRRVLDVMPDGTARLTVEPSGFWKTLFGERLCVDIEWSLKDGRISYRAKSGEPADKVRLATRMWGSRWTETT